LGALLLFPLYILANVYIILRSMKWLHACSVHLKTKWFTGTYSSVYVFLSASFLFSTFLPVSGVQRVMACISNYWLGVMLYILLFIGAADLFRLILKKMRILPQAFFSSGRNLVITGFIVSALTTGVSIYGVVHAGDIKTRTFDITVQKECGQMKDLNIVLAADMHLGYNMGLGRTKKMVERINALKPDIVVFAGDIFDNNYEAVSDPEQIIAELRKIQAKYGIYACYGNHDVSEKVLAGFTFRSKGHKSRDGRMDEFLELAGIKTLEDRAVLVDGAFYVAGRIDYKKPANATGERKTPAELLDGLDKSKPVFVIDHEPRQLQDLADAGADIDLSGHTHDGQLFPGNLLIRLGWENAGGYLKKGSMHSIVTSGAGVWGPSLRVGTDSEVVQVRVRFNK